MSDALIRAATEGSAIVPEQWSAAFVPTLLENLPFASLLDRSYQGDISGLGDTVNISSWPQFNLATELAEDARNDAEAITASGQQLVINKQVVKDFIVTRVLQRQGLEAMSKLRDLALHSIMEKMQDVIVAAISPSTSAPDHTNTYASGTTLALADLLDAKEDLDTANVPDDGSRQAVLGAAQYNDLFNITGFVSRDFIPAGSPLTSGSVSTPVLGFNVSVSTPVGNTAYLFHPQFMALAVQDNPAVEVYDLGVDGKRADRVNMTALFGVKQLSNVRVVSIS